MGFSDALTKTIKYESFDEFFSDVLNPHGNIGRELFNSEFVFRGENSNQYQLIPSALRDLNNANQEILFNYNGVVNKVTTEFEQYQYEQAIVNRFSKLANQQGLLLPAQIDDFFISLSSTLVNLDSKGEWPNKKQIELFGLAQHYGLPTRLLDFSYDIFIALYFAVFTHETSEYIRLYALRTTELQRFGDAVEFHVPQYYHNPNLSAQKGVFVFSTDRYDFTSSESQRMEINRKPLDEKMVKNFMQPGMLIIPYLYKIDISKKAIKELKNYLFKLGYFHSRVFPGFGGIKNSIIQENELGSIDTKNDEKNLE